MNTLLQSLWMERLGWALLHSLWQGAALWMLLSLVLVSARGLSAARRHHLACVMLLLFGLCPVITTAWLGRIPEGAPSIVAHHTGQAPLAQPAVAPAPIAKAQSTSHSSAIAQNAPQKTAAASPSPDRFSMQQMMPFLVLAWIAGVALLTLRLLSGLLWLVSLRRRAGVLNSQWRQTVSELCRRFALPQPVVRAAHLLGIPLVVGWFRPIIYLPAAMLTDLPVAEVEAVMLHEMAHLKRRDPLWQLVITVVETLLFYHPTTHALSRLARESAEQSCDDMVLAWTRDGKTYARALAALEESRGPKLVLAASASPLRHRLRRILGQTADAPPTCVPLRLGMTGAAGVAVFLSFSVFAVPRLAHSFTHEERVAAIEKQRAEVAAAKGPDEKPVTATKTSKPVAVGQIHLPENAAAPKIYRLGFYPPKDTDQRKEHKLTDVRAEITAAKETNVGVWAEDFAPAQALASALDPKTHQATFDLTLERGHPVLFRVVDEQSRPIAGALVHVATTWKSGMKLDRVGEHLVTSAEGVITAGRGTNENRFEADVLAPGYQWRLFADLNCADDQPVVLQLKRAHSIPVEVRDAETGKPVAACRTYAWAKRKPHGRWYSEYPVKDNEPGFSAPSDAAGHLELNVCDPEDEMTFRFMARGYQHVESVVTSDTRSLRIELRPAITLSGHIHDPDRLIDREDKNQLRIDVGWKSAPTTHNVTMLNCPDIPAGIPFDLSNVAPGEVLVAVQKHQWNGTLDKSVTGLELLVTKDGMAVLGPPELMDVTRRVEVQFDLPPGSPPMNGELRVQTRNRHPLMKVVNSRGMIDVEAPGKLEVTPGGISGWTFGHYDFDVNTKDEPKVFHIPCAPAGAMSGGIDLASINPALERNKAEGEPEPYFSVAAISDEGVTLPSRKEFKAHCFDEGTVETLKNPRRYFASGLPLPGKYRIRVQCGNFLAQSQTVLLDDVHPLAQQDIVFREGTVLSGQIFLPDGNPFRGEEIYVKYSETTLGWSLHVTKKEDGRFEVKGLNFAMPGRYLLCVGATRGMAPAVMQMKESPTDVTLKLERGFPLEVVLVDADDRPVSGVGLDAYASGVGFYADVAEAGLIAADAASDAQGRVHFSSLPACKLQIRESNRGSWRIDDDKAKALDTAILEKPDGSNKPLRLRVKRR